ncbi:uncharacterized protein LOC113373442 [Ctenocephalides felis]|uniref:uncharacterized protein LOC113373442 n=1 Tax=Ctenocephalides felis TaxID=7515 RepID=UPI000E6E4BEC|nr:uncharacterized protein LOC113373442 [Ctenocephalides felis]
MRLIIDKKFEQCCILIIVCLVAACRAVPAAIPDPLQQEVTAMRALVASVTGQLDKFNSLYLGSLEQKLISTATLLTNIDSNVKHLQERAHVWDTFQLHVLAWNEQIKTVDKKMDLLSREQEKLLDIDNKLTTLLGLEYKVQRVMEKLETFDSKFLELFEKIENTENSPTQTQNTQKDTIWNEFAGIGVLSTLKNIENKVDKLQQVPTKSYKRNAGRKAADNEDSADPRGKFVIRCSTPPQIEETIYEISAKVNALHDKSCGGKLPYRRGRHHGTEDDGDELIQTGRDTTWRRLTQPVRDSCLSEEDTSLLRLVADTTQELLDSGVQRETLSCCKRTEQEMQTFTGSADILLKRVERVAVGLESRESRREDASEARFREQREYFEKLLKNYTNKSSSPLPPKVHQKHYDENSKDGSGQSGFGLQDDTEEGDATEEDVDDDIRIIEVEPTTSTTSTTIVEITPATTPRTESVTYSTTETPVTYISPTMPTTTFLPKTTTRMPTQTTTEAMIFVNSTESDHTTMVTTTTTDHETMQVPFKRCEELEDSYKEGVYILGYRRDYNDAGRDFYTRYCRPGPDDQTAWTVIQSRGHSAGDRLDFNRDWQEYKNGFGLINEDFWMGNEYIHRLTNEQEVTLRIELDDFEGHRAWAEYSRFRVAGERDQYALQIGGYRGNASDSFGSHHGALFSTKDRDNDEAPPCCPCAVSYGGGWWFNSCFEANLNAPYYSSPHENEYFRGIIWENWLGDYSLRATRMMVRGKTLKRHATTSISEEEKKTSVPEDYDIPDDP